MRRSVIGWLTTATLVLASLGGADPARADTVVVGASDDASDDASVEERSPTRNFDGETTLRSDESPLTRAVLGFDVGAFEPSGASPTGAPCGTRSWRSGSRR